MAQTTAANTHLATDETHDPDRTSWVESANDPDTDFPIQNLPLGVFVRAVDDDDAATSDSSVGVAIGDRVLDLAVIAQAGLLDDVEPNLADILEWWSLNPLLWEGTGTRRALRARLSQLLEESNPELRDNPELRQRALLRMDHVEMVDPVEIGDYTDFYASIHHATNVGSMFRPDNPLLPNYKHIPIGYHGRASSIIPSGQPITRPNGQTKADEAEHPSFGPCKLLDYEMEVAAIVSTPNEMGEPVTIDNAEDHILGLVLCNDWSARDMQKWEYQPLGPFLAKSFATSISPWVVTLEALAPFRVPAFKRDAADPQPLPYLTSDDNTNLGGISLTCEVHITTPTMREQNLPPHKLSSGSFADMYWTIAQMLTHHASNGCNLHPGDMFASGTVSGPEKHNRGCLLELTWRGTEPIELPTGETRRFLQDGDEVIMTGYCQAPGFKRIGFGECRGIVEPAPVA